jgi:hypothetical protein
VDWQAVANRMMKVRMMCFFIVQLIIIARGRWHFVPGLQRSSG